MIAVLCLGPHINRNFDVSVKLHSFLHIKKIKDQFRHQPVFSPQRPWYPLNRMQVGAYVVLN